MIRLSRPLAATALVALAVPVAAVAAKPPPKPTNTITIAASPNPQTFGRAATVSGTVTGSGKGGITVELRANPYPYTGGYKPVATGTTTSSGAYSFRVVPPLNTRYQVTAKTKPPVTSAETLLQIRTRVTLRVGDTTPRRGRLVRFSGFVYPSHDGRRAAIQRRTATGTWVTIRRATLVATTPTSTGTTRSKYSVNIRIRRGGTFRTRLVGHPDHATGMSGLHSVRVHS